MVQETKNAWLENNDENYWGYFSIKQLKSSLSRDRGSDRLEYRLNYYYTLDGGEVLISEVSNQDPSKYHNNFDDVVKLGKIGKWKRSVPESEFRNRFGLI
jgi:hypothetical protein